MLLIDDLQVERDILPLFNFTHQEQSEAALRQLFDERPPTKAAVAERQAVVQAFLNNWAVLGNFSYSVLYFRGAQSFMQEVQSGRYLLAAGAKARWQFFFSEAKRHHVQSQVVQLILFLEKLHTSYLARLDLASFPPAFRAELTAANDFLGLFDLGAQAAAVRENAFTVSHILQTTNVLQKLTAEETAAFWSFLFRFEAYWSVAKGVMQHQLCFARFDDQQLVVEDLYHPLVPQAVRNTFRLRPGENVLLLTGPNMAGKSTFLKAISLCVYLAHLGLGVPATACTLPYFDTIAVSINLNDNLRSGYSHFMTELLHLKTVVEQLAQKGQQRCFAVFDELFRGTNQDDALDITQATVGGLTRFPRSVFFLSTHLLQLEEQLPPLGAAVGAYHIDCSIVDGRPVFSYRLRRGWSQLKIGRLLFDEVGLDRLLKS
ncbi:hypothetical protein F1C16_18565 [Hymenobacter sp. NBH84]|uniref:MutS-related protein n=1 Tax=Hymenobacter sp. NBH84 TaxID=2596915 RepID=UPI00162467F3|nr:hypothetical protein [Hymenobacter sp. NBH84]QNE41419.1 hypothetical protein F1C16_18565 [Hymenobacter sp. NBH84]